MKKKSTVFAYLSICSLLLLAACSKEKTINRDLWSKDGEWTITSWNEQDAYAGDTPDTYTGTGTLKFTKDGNGTANVSLNGISYSQPFTFKNTETELTLTWGGSFQIYPVGEVQIYSADIGKYAMKLTTTHTSTDDVGVYTETIQISCDKKK